MRNKRLIPFRMVIAAIVASLLVISGLFYGTVFLLRSLKEEKLRDPKYHIAALVQKSSGPSELSTSYVAELLDLSLDHPTNLHRFSAKNAKDKLLACPLIATVAVKKILPETLAVDYEVRSPTAFLIDYTNTALDHEGVALPFIPFFTPKNLPEVVLGDVPSLTWGEKLDSPSLPLALSLLTTMGESCREKGLLLKRIDVSFASASSCGQREIIVVVEEEGERAVHLSFSFFLRLHVEQFASGWDHFLNVRSYLTSQQKSQSQAPAVVVDLRIADQALLQFVGKT